MAKLVSIFIIVTLFVASSLASAQSVDAGRGDLPLTVPAGYSRDSAWPLIVLLHTYGRTGATQEEYMGLADLSDLYGFIMVAPDGTPSRANNNPLFWNASSACCNFDGLELDDSTYLANLIDEIKSGYRIDPKRVYIIGHSNGAFMAHRMAHDHSAGIAAIASLAGADQTVERPTPSDPVHVLQIHGDADEAIAYNGGEINGVAYPSAKQSAERWAERNGCATTGIDAGMLDLDRSVAGMESTVTRYTSGCKPGGSAEL